MKVDKLTRNGLQSRDVAYNCNTMVKQVGHVVMIMTSSLPDIQ